MVSFLTVILSTCLQLTWRSGGSVQSDSIYLLKPPKLLSPLLPVLAWLFIVKLSLLALLRLSVIDFKVINCSVCLIFKAPKSAHITPLLYDPHWLRQQLDSVQNSSHLLPHCLWCSSSILSQIFHVHRIGRRTKGERFFQFSIHWTCECDLENSSSLCQAFVFTLLTYLSQNWKPISSLLHIDLSFSSHWTNPSSVIHVFVVCVHACMFDETSIYILMSALT